MKTRSFFILKYNFLATGSQVEGSIRFALGQTVLGKVLIGRSQPGICTIFLGEDAQALRDPLATEFPSIEMQVDQPSLQRELNQIINFIDKDSSEVVINLDIGWTEFEQKIGQALGGIRTGKTRSYGQVAGDLGVPEAVRAVAGACAANVQDIAILGHRLVCRDDSISGYRWGVERERALLAEEFAL